MLLTICPDDPARSAPASGSDTRGCRSAAFLDGGRVGVYR